MKDWLNIFRQCQLILRTASWIVPRAARAEWRKEWEAELAYALRVPQTNEASARKRLRWRCCGAFLDAAWYRCNREDLRHTSRNWTQTPAFLLLALTSALLSFAVASGNLPRMRSILLRPPYGDPQRIATISRTGVINSAEWVVPYSWVEIWRRQAKTLEAVAAYRWKPQESALMIAGRYAKVGSVRVEDSLFQVFGVRPLLGRTSEPGDEHGSNNSLVLSYETWRRHFSSDPNILQKRTTIDGQEARVIGVLPQRFWFPSEDVGVWWLGNRPSFSGEAVGVVARLKPQLTDRWVEWALQRDITNAEGERFGDSSLQVWPVQDRIRQPLIFYALALCIALLVITPVFWSGRLNLRPQCAEVVGACRWWSFFGTKSFLLLLILLTAVVEFTAEPYVFPSGKATFIVESVSLWIFSIGCLFVLWWSLADQQSRCRVCLRKLVLPAHIGRSGCLLLGWVGTELACPAGHGLLHVTETDVCWLDPTQWTRLDESWASLFSEKSETRVFG
jgi:hypothetical protein